MKRSLITSILLVFLMGSCNVLKKGASGADAYENYQENLSESIIEFPDFAEKARESATENVIESVLAVDQDLTQALNKYRETNKGERYWSGFTVLVYSGVDRDLAFKTRNDLYTYFPDLKSDMQYQQPRYLVKVGKFINRIEAQAYYYQLKEQFPAVRIIQDRFQREGYVNSDPVQDGER